jgi:dihydroneopterin aldolase
MPLIKQKVALEGIRFYAYHGFYPEEQKIGNEFFIDLETEMTVEENLSDELSKTFRDRIKGNANSTQTFRNRSALHFEGSDQRV